MDDVTARTLGKWLPLAVAITMTIGVAYAFSQQVYRQGANDPQIALARDIATGIGNGESPSDLASGRMVDPSMSLSPFVMVFDAGRKVVATTLTLGGKAPQPPAGVLASAKTYGENRVTWQPRPDVRIAAVVVPVKGGAGGFVLAGRSLAVVEERVDALTQMAALGWLGTMIATFLTVLGVGWLKDRRKRSAKTV